MKRFDSDEIENLISKILGNISAYSILEKKLLVHSDEKRLKKHIKSYVEEMFVAITIANWTAISLIESSYEDFNVMVWSEKVKPTKNKENEEISKQLQELYDACQVTDFSFIPTKFVGVLNELIQGLGTHKSSKQIKLKI
jgi:hypothetical protein